MFWRKKKEEKKEEYKFSMHETTNFGDWYQYTVEGTSREDAFKKLVQFFFGEEINQPVKSESREISYPADAKFVYEGMPKWFAKRVSGIMREHKNDYQKDLEKYALKNNIKLKKRT